MDYQKTTLVTINLKSFKQDQMPKRKEFFYNESLRFVDEETDRFEGKFTSNILHLGSIPSIYWPK
jgi:hypothetical protein